MARLRTPALFLTALGLVSGCGDALSPAWRIEAFRIFGARIENTTRGGEPSVSEVAPGESVRIRLFTGDASAMPSPPTVMWVFCPQTQRTGLSVGCSPATAIVQMGAEINLVVPTAEYSRDPQNRARLQGIAIACANGTIGFDPQTMFPRCEGPGSTGWTMTRSLIVRLDETVPANRNPQLRRAMFVDGSAETELDPATPVRVPRCAADPCPTRTVRLEVSAETREIYETFNNAGDRIMQPERIVFGFFTDKGTLSSAFRTDTAERPMGPIQNTWTVPREPGTVRFVFTAQDPRGGFDLVERTVVVE
ncbi:MAG: hypothetical protein JNK72_24040 [Myxococcales bacterium]|nr:hypothetical protein [Myxococcales bacterium]